MSVTNVLFIYSDGSVKEVIGDRESIEAVGAEDVQPVMCGMVSGVYTREHEALKKRVCHMAMIGGGVIVSVGSREELREGLYMGFVKDRGDTVDKLVEACINVNRLLM